MGVFAQRRWDSLKSLHQALVRGDVFEESQRRGNHVEVFATSSPLSLGMNRSHHEPQEPAESGFQAQYESMVEQGGFLYESGSHLPSRALE